jgi:tetratricopeptide (TPR) repeat protein
MATVAEIFALALQYHQAGNLRQAEQVYGQILQMDPRHADSHHMLGAVAYQQGLHNQAVVFFRRALELNPSAAHYHYNLGMAYEALGRPDEATASYMQALRLQPNSAEAHNNLGNVCFRQKNYPGAVAHYRQAIHCNPNYAEAHYNLAVACDATGQRDEAIDHCRQALRIRPIFAEACNHLGNILAHSKRLDEAANWYRQALRINPNFADAHYGLGNALDDLGRHEEAVASFRLAIGINPDSSNVCNNLGNSLVRLDRLDEAIPWFHEALRLRPDYAGAYYNLGIALDRLYRFKESADCYRQALRIQPNFADASNNLGITLAYQNDIEEGLGCIEEALRQQPDLALAHFNRAVLWLLHGDFERGWPEYEWRWAQLDVPRRDFHQPEWDGSDLAGRTILLHAEQGLGDTIHFIRYARLVKDRGGQVVVECQPALLPLLTGVAGIDRLVAAGSKLPPFDVHGPLLCLPRIFRTCLTCIPRAVPYLRADPALVEHWGKELEPLGGFKIGIAWQGNPTFRFDRRRSISLAQFAPLAQVEGVRLISLQHGAGTEQLAALEGQFPVLDLTHRLDKTAGAFMDTAAIMMNLDLVISSDTAVPHLAGALGVPVWIALPLVPDWRWLLGREDSPWYPTLRLFRQTELEKWEDVFERMAGEIRMSRQDEQVGRT